MGKPRGATAIAARSSATKQVDAKSKAIVKGRVTAQKSAGKSYADDSGSGSDVEMEKKQAPRLSSPEQDQDPSSEEEEIIVKSKSVKRGAPAGGAKNNARTAREAAAASKSYKEPEASDEDMSDAKPSSPEVIPSDVEESGSDYVVDSSGSEYGKKSKKRKVSPKKSPAKKPASKRGRKKAGSASPKKRGRPAPAPASKSKNGRKAPASKKKAKDSDDEEESNASEDSEQEYRAKSSSSKGTKREAVSSPRGSGGRKSKPTSKKQNMDIDEDDEDDLDVKKDNDSGSEEEVKSVKKASPKKAKAPKREATPRQPASRASARKPATNKKISYAEIDNEEEEEEEVVLKPAPAKRKVAEVSKKQKNGDKKSKIVELDDEEEDEDIVKDKKPNSKKVESDSEGSEESEPKKPKTDGAADKKKDKKDEKSSVEAKDDDSDVEMKDLDNGNDTKPKDDVKKVEEPDSDDSVEALKAPTKEEKATNGKGELKNRTDTDYATLDFSCDKKTEKGEPWNLKIASWNIGGIKSWLAKNGLEYLQKESPDVLCLQEIKCSEKTRPESLKSIENYAHCYWLYSENAGQSGVATFCKTKPVSVEYGIPVGDDDNDKDKKLKKLFNQEGRLITTEFEKFYLLNTYVPNSGSGTTDEEHTSPYPTRICNGERQAWDKLFQDYIKTLEAKKPVIITGDLNVAHEAMDLANPATNKRNAGFTKEEREAMFDLLEETGLCDSFRFLYPNKADSYTFWSYRSNAREKNVGWRLDYFLISSKLRDGLCESSMRSQVYGSDHCPIFVCARL